MPQKKIFVSVLIPTFIQTLLITTAPDRSLLFIMSTKQPNQLFSNFISLSIVQGTNFLLPLLVMPYVISKIGADGFGIVAVAQLVMIYCSVISDYGFNLTASRDIALYQEEPLRTSQLFFTVLATRLLITAFLLVVLLLAAAFIPVVKDHFILYMLGFTYVVGQSLIVSWFFQGKQKMHFITLSTFIARLVFVLLVFVFIHVKEDGKYFLFFLGSGNIIAGLFSIFLAIRMFHLKYIPPVWTGILYELKEGWPIMVSNLSISTSMYSGVFILRIFTNDLVVGYYSIAERIFFAARQVLSVFSQAIYPHVCQLSQKSKAIARAFFQKFYLPFLLLVLAGSTILCILSPQIISVFLRTAPVLPVLILRMLSFVPVIVCLNIPAYQLLLAFDRKKSILVIFGLATVINITINILLAKNWGAAGTALSVIITELLITTSLQQQLFQNKLAGYVKPEHGTE